MSPEQNYENKAETPTTSPEAPEEMKSSKIRVFESSLEAKKDEFKRSLNHDGTGATRIRTFHVRLSDSAMQFLDTHIMEWIDENPDIEIKHSTTVIGAFEGKRGTEQQLIMNVWY